MQKVGIDSEALTITAGEVPENAGGRANKRRRK
jgi:hypothetical protein